MRNSLKVLDLQLQVRGGYSTKLVHAQIRLKCARCKCEFSRYSHSYTAVVTSTSAGCNMDVKDCLTALTLESTCPQCSHILKFTPAQKNHTKDDLTKLVTPSEIRALLIRNKHVRLKDSNREFIERDS